MDYDENGKAGAGRPCKFEPWMCEKILEIASNGGHQAAMMQAIGIKKTQFHTWKKEIPEFKDAIEEAKLISQSVYENILLQGAMGKIPGFNFNSISLLMHNKFPDEYKRGSNGSTVSNTEITINQLHLSPKEIDYKIAQKLEKLQALGIDLKGIDNDS